MILSTIRRSLLNDIPPERLTIATKYRTNAGHFRHYRTITRDRAMIQ